MELVLHEPEIPPNTGNIARLCAAFNIRLNLVEPLGFKLDNRYLKRAGLDYWPNVQMKVWPDWNTFFHASSSKRLILATSRGSTYLQDFNFDKDDYIILGSETRGLPASVLDQSKWHIRIPTFSMASGGVRCLNLSTAAGIFLFTAMNNCGLLSSLDLS